MMVDDLPTTRHARGSLKTGKSRSDDRDDGIDNDTVPDLRALVLPWASIVFLSVLAAASVYYHSSFASEHDPNNDFEFTASSETTRENNILERFLSGSDEKVHTPVHRPVFEQTHPSLFPLSTSDKLGFASAIVGLLIAAGGGIGGGGILVPIYILVMGFSPKKAIPLSNITVFGGAISNMLLNVSKRHPLADRPLIDWDLILVMEPLTIAGALIGAFLNKVLPELFLTIMLVILLSFTAYSSLQQAVKMYKAETRRLREQGLKPDGTQPSELTRIAQKEQVQENNQAGDELLKNMDLHDGENPGAGDLERIHADSKDAQDLLEILEEERGTQRFNLNILFSLFIVVLAINILKGGGAFPSPIGITCGSRSFWIANAIMLGWIVLISLFVRSYLVKRCAIKDRVGYKYVEGDIKWDSHSTIVYPCICCTAGLFAGMFGVGGGIVKGPLMLAMKVHPAVASASSATMILFTSFTATTSFAVFGLLDPQYGPICLVIGFLATYAGQVGLAMLMKRAKRNSYIAFSIGGVVLLSAILMTVQSLLSLAEGERHKSGGICGVDT